MSGTSRRTPVLHLAPLAGRGTGRLWRPFLERTPKQNFGYVASPDALRVRGTRRAFGIDLGFADTGPSPQPSPRKREEREISLEIG
jgi:hypothetical protein